MKKVTSLVFFLFIIVPFVLSGCNLPFKIVPNTPATSVPTALPPTEPPVAATEPMTAVTTAAPAETEPPAAVTSAPQATTAPAQITHTSVPTDSYYVAAQVAVDCNTGARLAAGSTQVVVSGCDYWNREFLERPADGPDGNYIPALDILWSQTGKSTPWIFLRIKVTSLVDEPAGYQAGFELDDNLDSRGDFLLLASEPKSTQWSTDGVQVWQDSNGDVGGSKPFAFDQNQSNGYDTQLFDSGVGQDPDLAWVRISPKDPTIIEFALKATVLPNPHVFGWWAWTGIGKLNPAGFEVVDRSQDDQTWDVDNSCSWIFGETPKEGQLANLCTILEPTATPAPTSVSGSCPVQTCPFLSFWDSSTCSCKRFFIIIPTATQVIIK